MREGSIWEGADGGEGKEKACWEWEGSEGKRVGGGAGAGDGDGRVGRGRDGGGTRLLC